MPAPKIPGYRIEGVIGRGATGVVYRAVQLAVERPVALKVLHPDLVGTRAVGRLQREARTTARLAHPGIVSAIDMGNVGGLWWYAMELVDGRSLAAILSERGAIGPREALRLFVPLCEALQHAHENGVVHRDVKPGNILVDRNRRARLVDLGLAFAEEDPRLTGSGGTLGTPYYISPEQARDPGAADARSDIWSLGATLYHAVCGRPPFPGESVAEILSGVLYSRIADPRSLQPRLSKDFALVLRKCLAREPEQRYQEARELLEDLERLVERRSVQVEARALDPLLGERDWTKLLLWGGAAALLLALIAGGVWWRTRARASGAVAPAAAIEAYAPLEELVQRIERGELLPGPALTAVTSLAAEVPPDAQPRLAEVRALAHRDYNQALRAVRRRATAELDALVDARRFVAAQRFLEHDFARELQRELGLGEQRLRAELGSDWIAAHRAQLDGSLRQALTDLGDVAGRLYDGRAARAAGALERERWRDAHAALAGGPLDWLAEARIDTSGLPAARCASQLAPLTDKLRARRGEIEKQWAALDERLADQLAAEGRALTDLLHRREAPDDVRRALEQAFEARLAELGLESDQTLREVAELAWSTLNVIGPALEDLQHELFVRDAEAWFARQEQSLSDSYARRDYRAVAAAWEAAGTRGWPEPVAGRIRVRREEAELLQGLLQRAARGVLERVGGTETFYVGSIAATGTLEVRGDPLENGFDLRPSAAGRGVHRGAHHLELRVHEDPARGALVLHADLERLAGLPKGSASLTPADRLARVALRLREQDVEAAVAALASGAVTGLEPLAADLRARIADESHGLAALEGQRVAEADRLYNLVKREVRRERSHTRDAREALALVDELLRDYLDLEFVRARAEELRAIRARLRPAEVVPAAREELDRLYAPDVIGDVPDGVRLTYAFERADPSSAWSRGEWRYDGLGWSSPGLRALVELAQDTRWPRLVLGPPLDLSVGRLDATFAFEQLESAGPPRLLIVSVAGVHVALAGAEEARVPRWGVASGREGLDELIGDVPGGAGEAFAGLARGGRHELSIELRRGRGRARVLLDGRELGVRTLSPPTLGEPGSASIVVRSLEPVRLLNVELEAPVE